VTNVLGVPALQIGDPVQPFVLMKSDDLAPHTVPVYGERRPPQGGLPILFSAVVGELPAVPKVGPPVSSRKASPGQLSRFFVRDRRDFRAEEFRRPHRR
jgi:hypothetical protein